MSYTPLSFSPVPRANPQDDYSFVGTHNNHNNQVTLSNYNNNNNNNNNNSNNSLKQHFEEMRQERKNVNNQNQAQNQQRALSPIRERANLTLDAFSSTLADIDRRTLRSQTYVTKKLDPVVTATTTSTETNNKQSTRFHRVARDVPSYDANQTFSYYATHNEDGSPKSSRGQQNNNMTHPPKYQSSSSPVLNNNNTITSGLKLKEIQEEITRRRLQSEKTIIAAAAASSSPSHPYQVANHNNRSTTPQQQQRYQTLDEEQSSALKKRLEDARRNTLQSFNNIFTAAINSLVRRENEERGPIMTEQTQQFARLTAHKALQYANVINSPQKKIGDKNQQHPYHQQDDQQPETPAASELQRFLQMSGYKPSPTKEQQQQQNDITNPKILDDHPLEENSHTAARRRDIVVDRSSRPVDYHDQNQNIKSSAPLPSSASYVENQQDQRIQMDNATLRHLFVQETFMKNEIRLRENLVNEAFDQALNLALRMNAEKPNNNNNNSQVSEKQAQNNNKNNAKTREPTKQDVQALTTMFVTEVHARAEFEVRQGIMSEAFDSRLTIMATFVNLLPREQQKQQQRPQQDKTTKSTAASPTATTSMSEKEIQKMAQKFKDDKNTLREMFVIENCQYREAQNRVGLLLDALNETAAAFGVASASLYHQQQRENVSDSTVAPAVVVVATSSNNKNNKSSMPSSSSKTTAADSALLKNMFVGENFEHREARRRQEILLEALIEYSFIVNAVNNSAIAAVKNINNINNSSSTIPQQKSSARGGISAQDQGLLKSLFIVENMEHRESQARQKLLLEALTETFVLFQRFKPVSGTKSSASSASSTKVIEVSKSTPPANAASLHATIMLETLVLRESEQRNCIESECWRSYLGLHQFHDVFLVRNMKENEKNWSFETSNNNNNTKARPNGNRSIEQVEEDLSLVKSLFVVESLKRREAEARSAIAQEAFLFNVNSLGWRVPFDIAAYSSSSRSRVRPDDQEETTASTGETNAHQNTKNINNNNNNNKNNNNAISERAKRDIACLRSTVLEEFCFRREVDARSKIQEQYLLELLPVVRAFDQKNNTNINLNSTTSLPNNNNNNSLITAPRSRPASASSTAENSSLLRFMFIHENLFHRELGNRASLSDTESAERLQLIISFYAVALEIFSSNHSNNNFAQGASASASSPLPPRPNSAAMFNRSLTSRPSRPSSAQQDAKFLREMFVIENFTKKESESRHNLEQEQFMCRLELSTVLHQEMVMASPNRSNHNNNNGKPLMSPAFAAERKLLREMFIVENLEHRESTARSAIVEDSLRTLMFLLLASAPNSSSSPSSKDQQQNVTSATSSSSSPHQDQQNLKVITQLQFFREESRARVSLLNEESQGAIELAMKSRPLKQALKGRLRALQDVSVLRQMFVAEQFIRKEAEVRADLALQASLGGVESLAKVLSSSSPVKKPSEATKQQKQPQVDDDDDEM